jgi:hypothetical protein
MSVSSVVNRGVFECGVAVRTTTIVDSVVRSLFDALIERRKFANCLVVDTFGVPAEGLHDLIGAGARPRSFLQHLQIGALSKGNLRNRQPVHR